MGNNVDYKPIVVPKSCDNKNCLASEECVLHDAHKMFKVSECCKGYTGHSFCSYLKSVVPIEICKRSNCPSFEECMND